MSNAATIPLHSEISDLGKPFSVWEALGVLLALLLGFHFLALRVFAGGLPGGDEGSWLSVAAELARGHGFTTHWLEAHFLTPYTLPRPDDFRYPALTSLLAMVFRAGFFSLEAARWTVTAVFLAFVSSLYLICRSTFGRWTAMATLWLTVSSLFQLEWNSIVYTEGLFGLVLAWLTAWCLRGERTARENTPLGFSTLSWWAILGIGVGALYLVRANGILFLPGIVWLYWRRRKQSASSPGLSWRHPAIAIAGFTLITAPWLIRTGLNFGNPFHVAGSAGILREVGEPHTLTVVQYLSQYDLLFPLRHWALGVFRFFKTLHEFEHGMESAPVLLALVAVVLRRPFFSPFLVVGFLLTFAASAYAACNSWAGIRYMSALVPFIYAYGLSLPAYFAKTRSRFSGPWMSAGASVLGIALLLLPVVYPHRFYERKFSQNPEGRYAYRWQLADHLARLETRLPKGGRYYAASLCKVNFLLEDRDCVGLQELYDPTWFPRSMQAFHPHLIVLTHAETSQDDMLTAMARMRSEGYAQDTLESGPLAVYLSLHTTVPTAINKP